MQMAGGLLLADRLDEGRVWLEALATITPAIDAISNPIPRRTALIGLLLLELIQPSRADQAIWITELRNLRWLPPSRSEHQLWLDWLEPFLSGGRPS